MKIAENVFKTNREYQKDMRTVEIVASTGNKAYGAIYSMLRKAEMPCGCEFLYSVLLEERQRHGNPYPIVVLPASCMKHRRYFLLETADATHGFKVRLDTTEEGVAVGIYEDLDGQDVNVISGCVYKVRKAQKELSRD